MKVNKIFWWFITIIWSILLFELIQMFFFFFLTKVGVYLSNKLFDEKKQLA